MYQTIPDWIGLAGQMGSGKTTVAKTMLSILSGSVPACILPLAAPIKKIAVEMGWNGEKDDKGRRLLQLLGTECGRQCIDQDVWINKWHQDAQEIWEKIGEPRRLIIIADDLRFANEALWILKHGGIVIHVYRPDNLELRCSECVGHVSEQGFPPEFITAKINNNGASLETLIERTENILIEIDKVMGSMADDNQGIEIHNAIKERLPRWWLPEG
jgi:hypothetical protein